MKKKFFKKAIVTAMAFCFIATANLSASENIDILTETPPSVSETSLIQTYGSSAPSSSADIHDLSVSDYNYQATNMGYRIYTSKWLTGAKKIKVTVSNWTLLESYNGAINNELTVYVYNSKKNEVVHKKIAISSGCGSGTLTGLKASKNYYVCFEVPTNGNRYSYNGTIQSK